MLHHVAAVHHPARSRRPLRVLLLLGALFVSQQHGATADAVDADSTLTNKPPARQPWLTLYGPLRLGVDADDDNHTLSALGTWLRLDCPAGKGGLVPARPRPEREDDVPASKEDALDAGVRAAWPMPSHASSATPPDIILFTDDQGETCKALNAALGLGEHGGATPWDAMRARVRCLNECVHPHHRRLDVACIIEHAAGTARTPVMSLVNSDIALGADFVRTMQGLFFSVQGASPKHGGGDNMLVIGRRTDVNLPTPRIDFDATDWSATVRNLAMEQGHLHSEYGIDYLVTTRPGIWATPHASAADDPAGSARDQLLKTRLFADDQRPAIEMPPFLVGVYRWDSFALARAILSPAIAVIDATAAVTAVHLQQASAGEPPKHRGRRGASYSDRLVHNTIGKRYLMGRTVNADYELTAGGELLARVSPLAM